MNHLNCSLKKLAAGRLWVALAVLSLSFRAPAQPATESPQRWLLIFDTSSSMKSRQPAVTAELENLFISSFGNQLHTGDSIGVWTFNRKINAGEFPLATWTPQFAAAISSNIVAYLGQQHYAGNTTFAALNPTLSRVIDNSERLTVVIFCDGADKIKLTPYDDGINQTFKQSKAEREKSNQPFVLIVRTQRGEFVGATVNLPPGSPDLPPFPPLPSPPPAPVAPTNPPPIVALAPPPAPVISLPPLVIIGTNVGTNIDDLPKIVPPPRVIVTNAPPIIITNIIVITNSHETAAVAPATPPSNAPAASVPAAENIKPATATVVAEPTTVVVASTNTAAATNGDGDGDNGARHLILVGIGLLAAAVVLVFVLARQRPRAAHESLITSSMQDDPRKK